MVPEAAVTNLGETPEAPERTARIPTNRAEAEPKLISWVNSGLLMDSTIELIPPKLNISWGSLNDFYPRGITLKPSNIGVIMPRFNQAQYRTSAQSEGTSQNRTVLPGRSGNESALGNN